MSLARSQGTLKYKEHKIFAPLDPPPKILMKRKLLKPITDQLKNNNIRFRWSPKSDIIVARNGAQYRAGSVACLRRKHVLICRHSFIFWAAHRAKWATVEWLGCQGMRWPSSLALLLEKRKGPNHVFWVYILCLIFGETR